MSYDIPTLLFDLGDGDQAVILAKMRHKTQRKVIAASAGKWKVGEAGVEMDPETNLLSQDIMVLNQTVSWRFNGSGDKPVTQEVLDDMDVAKRGLILAKMNELYGGASADPLGSSG